MKLAKPGLVLATLATLLGCGNQRPQNSAAQSLASSANSRLIEDIVAAEKDKSRKEIRLADVLADNVKYGLGQAEVKTIRAAFTAEELNSMVLHVIDPNRKLNKAQAQWVFIPDAHDDSAELKSLSAFGRDGREQLINGAQDPEACPFPIITIARSERMEGALRLNASEVPKSDGALMLNTVEFSDVQEPWIKGAAEMYAVVTFFGKDGKGRSSLVDLYGVGETNVKYDLRQLLHMWPENRYQIANISFMEHDSGYNYSQLAQIFVTAASSIITSIVDPTQVLTITLTGIVSDLAGKVIAALPSGVWTDDDDFVDTINTIEKYSPGLRAGVGGKVKAELSYYTVKINDE